MRARGHACGADALYTPPPAPCTVDGRGERPRRRRRGSTGRGALHQRESVVPRRLLALPGKLTAGSTRGESAIRRAGSAAAADADAARAAPFASPRRRSAYHAESRVTSGKLGQARATSGQSRSISVNLCQSRVVSGNLASSEPVRPRPRHSASIAASLSSTPTPATRGEGYECSGVRHIFSRVGVRRPAIPHLGLDIGGEASRI